MERKDPFTDPDQVLILSGRAASIHV